MAQRKPLRILVVTNMYPSARRPHFGMFVAEQVEQLRMREEVDGVDVLFIDGLSSTLNYLRGALQLRRALRRTEYDLVHAHYGLTGFVAVTQRRVPVVITFHGSDVDDREWRRWPSRLAGARAAANICVSRRGMGVLRRPATHLPCGIDLQAFAPQDRAHARASFGVAPGALALLFPGPKWHRHKGYGRFEQVRDTLRARGRDVHELRMENIDRERVPALMSAADVLVMTSNSEGTPVSVMEALATGLPIVSVPVGDVAEMLEGAPGTQVAEFDASVFADAVERLAHGGPRSPALQSRTFDHNRVVSDLLDVYRSACRSNGDGHAARVEVPG